MKKIKLKYTIGIYDSSDRPSGLSRYVENLLSEIDQEEFIITIFGDSCGPHPGRQGIRFVSTSPISRSNNKLNEKIEDSNQFKFLRSDLRKVASSIWRHSVPNSVRYLVGFGSWYLRLKKIFRENPVDLFHTNETGCEPSAISSRMAGTRIILGTLHVDSTYEIDGKRSGPIFRFLGRCGHRCLDRAIAVSEATKQDWLSTTYLPPSRVSVIPNGVDLDKFRRNSSIEEARARLGITNQCGPVIGSVGRLELAKGFSDLLEAVATLVPDYPSLILVIAGEGVLRDKLQAQAQRLGIAERIHFLGFRTDVREVMEAFDVYVSSSWCEAMPFAVLEAMAMGLPVLGTAVGGVPEVIEHGTTGFLVPPHDPQALASFLRKSVADDQLRARMGEAGRCRVIQHFNQADSVRQTIDVYREMLRDVNVRSRN